MGVAEKLRQMHKALTQDAIAQGHFVSRTSVEAELVPIHQAVRAAVRHAFREAEARLRQTNGPGEWAAAVEDVAAGVDRLLASSIFSADAA